jgi:TolA-binding protein
VRPLLIRSLVLLPVILALALLSGCVYYNTFYHAQEAAREAELLRENRPPDSEPGMQEKELLERVVEKSGRVLREHPNSSWADDALLLAGTALYHQGKYESSEARLTEFQTRFPESELRYEADYTLAAVLLAKGSPISAEGLLEAVAFAEPPNRLSDDALMLMGRARHERKMYDDAAETFLIALEHFPNSDRRAEIRFLAAENYVAAGRPEEAARHYSAVADERGARNLLFEARIRLAGVMIELDDAAGALEVLDDLERRTEARDDLDRILLLEGRTYEAIGDFEQAISTYEGIAASHEKSEASAEAFYRIGLIQRDEWEDLDEASKSLKTARDESPRSDIGKMASEAATYIETLKGYLAEIEEFLAAPPEPAEDEVEIEGGEARDDTPLEEPVGALPDSLDSLAGDEGVPEELREGAAVDSLAGDAGAPIESAEDAVVDSLAGEAGSSEGLPEGAAVESLPGIPPEGAVARPDRERPGGDPRGDDLHDRPGMNAIPESLRQRWGAAAREDSLRRLGYDRHDRRPPEARSSSSLVPPPDTMPPEDAAIDSVGAEDASHVSALAGRPGQAEPADASTPADPEAGVASARFRVAELYLFKFDDHEKAAEHYRDVVTEHATDVHAPRAALALAWILERKVGDPDGAVEAYRAVIEGYPETEQAESAMKSIERLLGHTSVPLQSDAAVQTDAPAHADTAAQSGAVEQTDAPESAESEPPVGEQQDHETEGEQEE